MAAAALDLADDQDLPDRTSYEPMARRTKDKRNLCDQLAPCMVVFHVRSTHLRCSLTELGKSHSLQKGSQWTASLGFLVDSVGRYQ